MPLILAFDVSAGRAAVALSDGAAILAEREERREKGHAERLFPLIEECLAAAGRAYADIDLIAVCTGPGNFTGARIGVAAARGLALSCKAQAVGVDRFEALAEGRSGAVCVALVGRGGAIHVARFKDGAPTLDAATLKPEDAAAYADGAELIGDGAADLAAVVEGGAAASTDGDAPLSGLISAALRKRADAPRPAPRYLRPVNAALPREAPPAILP